VFQRWLPSKTSALNKFYRKYGWGFETLEVGRQKLHADIARLVQQDKVTDTSAIEKIRQRATKLEIEFEKILEAVKADKTIDLKTIRTELKKMGSYAIEGSAELLQKELGMTEDVRIQKAGGERQFTYEWGKTNDLETRLRGTRLDVRKSSDPVSGLRTLSVRFTEGDPWVTFQERPSPFPARQEVTVNPLDPMITKLLNEFSLTDPAAQRFVLHRVTLELSRNPKGDLKGPVKNVRRYLRALQKKDPGKSIEQKVLEQRKQGFLASQASSALISEAQKLIDLGILQSPQWLSARTIAEFQGTVGEWLGVSQTITTATVEGKITLRQVRFIGNLYKDAMMTRMHQMSSGRLAVNVDVVPELDLLTATKQGINYEYHSLANIKVAKSGRAATRAQKDAASQNQKALQALRGHIQHKVFSVTTESGQMVYGLVRAVKGIDALTGKEVVLTDHLYEASKITTETVGPKDTRSGFTKELPYSTKDISTIVDILRENQLMKSPEY